MEAIFAGGCFWCTQKAFDELSGVVGTEAGYTGGSSTNPSYKEVCAGTTGHVEAVKIIYDPKKVSYSELLEAYWSSIEPQNFQGQFCDIGSQYLPVIFYLDQTQKKEAVDFLSTKKKAMDHIAVSLKEATPFFPAEKAHQKYYLKNKEHYEAYARARKKNQ